MYLAASPDLPCVLLFMWISLKSPFSVFPHTQKDTHTYKVTPLSFFTFGQIQDWIYILTFVSPCYNRVIISHRNNCFLQLYRRRALFLSSVFYTFIHIWIKNTYFWWLFEYLKFLIHLLVWWRYLYQSLYGPLVKSIKDHNYLFNYLLLWAGRKNTQRYN